jgi:hypothetical protein
LTEHEDELLSAAAQHEDNRKDNLVLLMEKYGLREQYDEDDTQCALIDAVECDNVEVVKYLYERKLYPKVITLEKILTAARVQPNMLRYMILSHGLSLDSLPEHPQHRVPPELQRLYKNITEERKRLSTAMLYLCFVKV